MGLAGAPFSLSFSSSLSPSLSTCLRLAFSLSLAPSLLHALFPSFPSSALGVWDCDVARKGVALRMRRCTRAGDCLAVRS